MRAEYVTGEQARLILRYLADKTRMPYDLQDGLYAAFALLSDSGDFCGGVIIHNWRQIDCEVILASETPLAWRKAVCETIFGYVFEKLGCVRMTAITTKRNRRARVFMERFGFVLEGCARRAIDGRRDALIYGLLAKDCTFINKPGGSIGEEIGASGATGT